MKAGDISDQAVAEEISRQSWDWRGRTWHNGCRWVFVSEVADALDIPWKVALAKVRKMIRRGDLGGCYCGCRGDLFITEQGAEKFGLPAYVD